MRRILMGSILSIWITSAMAWADNNPDPPPPPDKIAPFSVTQSPETAHGYLPNEVLGIKPQVGVLIFNDQFGNSTTRAVYGITIDDNLAAAINKNWTNLFLALSSGAIYSHLGDPDSNFWGTHSPTSIGAANANLVIIPANLKVGYNFNENFRLAAHGGGNVVYRSISDALYLGASSAVPGSVWSLFPNVGGDLEFGLGRHSALMLRPDWTITPGNMFFTGTLALNIPIG